MRTITIEDIRSWNPCYDPSEYLPEGWSGTALDILAVEDAPAEDLLWCVLREGVLDPINLRLAACAFVRRTPLADGRTVWDLLTDERSRNAVDIAERYARGAATDEELAAARAATGAAARAAAGAAARAAAWAAARDAAWDAATDAATDAAWAAARAAASAAARAAEQKWQTERFREVLST